MLSSFDEHKGIFVAFLDAHRSSDYDRRIHDLSSAGGGRKSQRLLINVNDVRQFDPKLATQLLRKPLQFLDPWTEAITERMRHYSEKKTKPDEDGLGSRTHLGFIGAFGSHHVSPRELRACQLGTMVCVEGVVTRCSLTQPKIVRSVHWCEATQQHTVREYRDSASLDINIASGGTDANSSGAKYHAVQTSITYPTNDIEGNVLETEFGLSVYKDHQCVTIQESPESAPLGQLPRSVELFLDDDLVDSVKPGDRVRCAGIYRALTHNGALSSGFFRTVVLANSVASRGHDKIAASLTSRDVANIQALAKQLETRSTSDGDVIASGFGCALHALAAAFAPSIYGHEAIKRALVLQLVGGTEKKLLSGSRLRGDVNVLLVGDPSTAKSQLLRAAMRVAPLAVCTTGRGSSGVGLTAAVTHDSETGDRRLEAGAVVLADRGLVCIDEFDKMSAGDRVAIHEVMEQQTVTLAKAGIHASLNARCAVLAAANPVYGQYDTDRRPQENVGLPDSLLSRFDLLFIVLDNVDTESDRHVADHVLASHQYRSRGQDAALDPIHSEGSAQTLNSPEDDISHVWRIRFGTTGSHKHLPADTANGNELPYKNAVLHLDFVRKYIGFARHRVDPKLSEEARESIANAYADLRAKADDRSLPVTARCLESLIRIATAHAKVRLSAIVDGSDCHTALMFLSYALYGDTKLESKSKSISPLVKKLHAEESVNKRPRIGEINRNIPSIDVGLRQAYTDMHYKVIVDAYTMLASTHAAAHGKVHIAELSTLANSYMSPEDAIIRLDEIELILLKLQAENRLMYDETNRDIHFL
jgi:DNA replication licensing factor MCM3